MAAVHRRVRLNDDLLYFPSELDILHTARVLTPWDSPSVCRSFQTVFRLCNSSDRRCSDIALELRDDLPIPRDGSDLRYRVAQVDEDRRQSIIESLRDLMLSIQIA